MVLSFLGQGDEGSLSQTLLCPIHASSLSWKLLCPALVGSTFYFLSSAVYFLGSTFYILGATLCFSGSTFSFLCSILLMFLITHTPSNSSIGHTSNLSMSLLYKFSSRNLSIYNEVFEFLEAGVIAIISIIMLRNNVHYLGYIIMWNNTMEYRGSMKSSCIALKCFLKFESHNSLQYTCTRSILGL